MKFYREFLLVNFSYRAVTDLCKLLETSTVLERKIDFEVPIIWLFSRNSKLLLNTCAEKETILDLNKTRNEKNGLRNCVTDWTITAHYWKRNTENPRHKK